MFSTMSGIAAALCLTAVPLYFWGKRYRVY